MRLISLLILVMLASCTPHPRQVYICTITKARVIGQDTVETYRVYSAQKKGWLSSDRVHLVLEDGTLLVRNGKWDVALTPAGEEE